MTARLGSPRLHLRAVDSTNTRARELAARGAPHGTLVTAAVQTAGRGRQGRTWTAPPGRALLCSLVVHGPPQLLSLRGGVAVADAVSAVAGRRARVKWPNDVLVDGRKVAGILVEARPQEGWAVLGAGVNVALGPGDFPPALRGRAGTLGLEPAAIEATLAGLLEALQRWLIAPAGEVLEALRARDALRGERVTWAGGSGRGEGIDETGQLRVVTDDGRQLVLSAGEVHLWSAS